MNKVDMLDAINAKKQQVIDLVNADKLDEAKEAKAELQTMQDKFDLLDDIEVEDKVKVEDAEEVTPMAEIKKDAIHEFAMAARRGFRNAATDAANESTPATPYRKTSRPRLTSTRRLTSPWLTLLLLKRFLPFPAAELSFPRQITPDSLWLLSRAPLASPTSRSLHRLATPLRSTLAICR